MGSASNSNMSSSSDNINSSSSSSGSKLKDVGRELHRHHHRVVKVVLMQRDEEELLPDWLFHHIKLFGIENVHVVDHQPIKKGRGGRRKRSSEDDVFDDDDDDEEMEVDHVSSSSQLLLRSLHDLYGLDVRTYEGGFEGKAEVLTATLLELAPQADILLPLDCDEFVVLKEESKAVAAAAAAAASPSSSPQKEKKGKVVEKIVVDRHAIRTAFDMLPMDGRAFKLWARNSACNPHPSSSNEPPSSHDDSDDDDDDDDDQSDGDDDQSDDDDDDGGSDDDGDDDDAAAAAAAVLSPDQNQRHPPPPPPHRRALAEHFTDSDDSGDDDDDGDGWEGLGSEGGGGGGQGNLYGMAKSFYPGGFNFVSTDSGQHYGSVAGDLGAGHGDKLQSPTVYFVWSKLGVLHFQNPSSFGGWRSRTVRRAKQRGFVRWRLSRHGDREK
jgi:hypothetical protein